MLTQHLTPIPKTQTANNSARETFSSVSEKQQPEPLESWGLQATPEMRLTTHPICPYCYHFGHVGRQSIQVNESFTWYQAVRGYTPDTSRDDGCVGTIVFECQNPDCKKKFGKRVIDRMARGYQVMSLDWGRKVARTHRG